MSISRNNNDIREATINAVIAELDGILADFKIHAKKNNKVKAKLDEFKASIKEFKSKESQNSETFASIAKQFKEINKLIDVVHNQELNKRFNEKVNRVITIYFSNNLSEKDNNMLEKVIMSEYGDISKIQDELNRTSKELSTTFHGEKRVALEARAKLLRDFLAKLGIGEIANPQKKQRNDLDSELAHNFTVTLTNSDLTTFNRMLNDTNFTDLDISTKIEICTATIKQIDHQATLVSTSTGVFFNDPKHKRLSDENTKLFNTKGKILHTKLEEFNFVKKLSSADTKTFDATINSKEFTSLDNITRKLIYDETLKILKKAQPNETTRSNISKIESMFTAPPTLTQSSQRK